MKKLIVAVLIITIMVAFCACGTNESKVTHESEPHVAPSYNNSKATAKMDVSSDGDPMAYFTSDSSWTVAEIEEKFGAFEITTVEDYGTYSYATYSRTNTLVFGESWELWIRVMEEPDVDIRGGCFSFNQENVSDEMFDSYRDEIVSYYTVLYGKPDPYCGTEEMPAWRWNTSTMTIVLQDCRALAGNLQLSFSG